MKSIGSCSNMAISEDLMNIFVLPEFSMIFGILHISEMGKKIQRLAMIFLFVFYLEYVCVAKITIEEKKGSIWSLIFVLIAFTWSLICLGAESTFVYFNF